MNSLITIVISLIAVAVSIISLIYSFFYNRKIIRGRATIEAYLELQSYLYCIYEYPQGEIEDFIDDRSSDEYKKLSNCIAHIEIFALGVKHGVYDINLVYELSHGYLDMTLRKPIEHILEIKSKRGKEQFYKGTYWLLGKMDKRSRRT